MGKYCCQLLLSWSNGRVNYCHSHLISLPITACTYETKSIYDISSKKKSLNLTSLYMQLLISCSNGRVNNLNKSDVRFSDFIFEEISEIFLVALTVLI